MKSRRDTPFPFFIIFRTYIHTVSKSDTYLVLIFILFITLLSLASSWVSLSFHFWRNDWEYLLFVQQGTSQKLLLMVPHPGTWVEDVILFPIFKWNPFYWNVLGLFVRVLFSFVASLLLYALTHSRKTALATGLLLAASPFGLETIAWNSAHSSPFAFIFFGLGFAMFITKHTSQTKYLILTVLLLLVGFIFDPGRILFVIVLLWIYFGMRAFLLAKSIPKSSFLVLLLYSLSAFFIFLLLPVQTNNTHLLSDFFPITMTRVLHQALSLFNGIANLIRGIILPAPESGAIAQPNILLSFTALFGFVILFCGAIIIAFFKRSRHFTLIAFFMMWIIFAYLPNWINDTQYIPGATHRYLYIASIGYIGILAVLLSFIRSKIIFTTILLALLCIQIINSNLILTNESFHRNKKTVDRILTMMTKTSIEENRQYYLYGDKLIINSIFWGGRKWPFLDYGGIIRSHTLPVYQVAYHGKQSICQDFQSGKSLGIWEIDQYKAYFFSEKKLIEAFCKTP